MGQEVARRTKQINYRREIHREGNLKHLKLITQSYIMKTHYFMLMQSQVESCWVGGV